MIPTPGQPTNNIVSQLYVKKSDGSSSNNLVFGASANNYGLGFQESFADANTNDPGGFSLPNASSTITILQNTPDVVQIKTTVPTWKSMDYSEIWTFWAGRPYFQSVSSSTFQGTNTLLNQYQACDMVSTTTPYTAYVTDQNGAAQLMWTAYNNDVVRSYQPLNSPNLNTYPWVNYQFTNEGVSLGYIFTKISDPLSVVGETGDPNFEYQINWYNGGGDNTTPVNTGANRGLTTLYYVASSTTNNFISNFAQTTYQDGAANVMQNPVTQATAFVSHPYGQAAGTGSALLNSPYFLVRHNGDNPVPGVQYPQYHTAIFGPLFGWQQTTNVTPFSYANEDYQNQLQYTLNYDNNSSTFIYGTTTDMNPVNGANTSIQMVATSTDQNLLYNTIMQTWNDSDKLDITGTASNNVPSVPVKDIWLNLHDDAATTSATTATANGGTMLPNADNIFAANTANPTSAITTTLGYTDNLWTSEWYGIGDGTYGDLSGSHWGNDLIFWAAGEHVPPLDIPLTNVATGTSYDLIAGLRQQTAGPLTYTWSLDGVNYSTTTVPTGATNTTVTVNLGVHTITTPNFWIDDMGFASSTYTQAWGGWAFVQVLPVFHSMGTTTDGYPVYDLQMNDPILGKKGIAVKVLSPTTPITLTNNNEDLNVYLFSTSTEQTLPTFSYPFDIQVWPHSGWLTSPNDFTALHTQYSLPYTQHNSELLTLFGNNGTVFHGSTSVALSSDGASQIWYTIDGSTPTCSTGILYTGPLTFSNSTSLKAIGCDAAGNSSVVTAAIYSPASGGGGGAYVPVRTISSPASSFTVSSTTPIQQPINPTVSSTLPTEPATSSPSPAPRSSGLTTTQIQSILSLLSSFNVDAATIANVQMILSTGATGANISHPFAFTRNLSLNQTNADVKTLQQFLNTHGFTVTTQGPGSPGNETTFFGRATYLALIKFQKSVGLPATGWFGPMTRGKISAL